MGKIKVLVVDDSAFNRRSIEEMLNSSPEIEVVGVAVNGEDALKKLVQLKPDVVSLDLEMPVMDGFAFIRISMVSSPIPIVVVSSKKDEVNIFKALDLGAVDFVAKPSASVSNKLFDIKEELIEKIIIASYTKLHKVKNIVDKFRDYDIPAESEKSIKTAADIEPQAPVKEPSAPIEAPAAETESSTSNETSAPLVASFNFKATKKIECLAVGASTGGPAALKTLFKSLPISLNVAVAISQHMPEGFTSSFAKRLDCSSEYIIKEAADGELLEKGKVLIAPGGKHLTFVRAKDRVLVRLLNGRPTDDNIPSVNYMFDSAAQVFNGKVLGIVLTGMGHDGKKGVIKINEAGGKVIAESDETAVVFGMPNEAIKTGKVDKIAPLDKISEAIEEICNKSKKE